MRYRMKPSLQMSSDWKRGRRAQFVSYFLTCAYMSHALDRYVSELSYIHTKLMIVDDRRVIVRIPPSHSAQYCEFMMSFVL